MLEDMQHPGWITALLFAIDLVIRVGLSLRVIMRRRPVGVSLAWLSVILIFPFGGAIIYLLIGETRLGRRRMARLMQIQTPYHAWLEDLRRRAQVDWSPLGAECEPLSRLAEKLIDIPALPGNKLELFPNADAFFAALIQEINRAQRTCHLEFYIWYCGGHADAVAEALLQAVQRGVACRVLVDAVGSHDFLRSPLVNRLREGGVQIQVALPVSLRRMIFVRSDLRIHRKIVVIDGARAFTGSLNLVDPRFFKQEAGVGEWVDAMVRLTGPAVEALAITFLGDWECEAAEGIDRLRQIGDVQVLPDCGNSAVQVLPSGPVGRSDAIQQVLLTAIYAARRELVLTTPYFVPDEPLLAALVSAALRGVEVTLVVPARVDSRLVRYASRAHQGDLLAAGAKICLFEDGLLHTKSITADGEFSLFGSLNLDPRSLRLNFEITLAVYDPEFTQRLRELQQTYVSRSKALTLAEWQATSKTSRFIENAARLVGPLL